MSIDPLTRRGAIQYTSLIVHNVRKARLLQAKLEMMKAPDEVINVVKDVIAEDAWIDEAFRGNNSRNRDIDEMIAAEVAQRRAENGCIDPELIVAPSVVTDTTSIQTPPESVQSKPEPNTERRPSGLTTYQVMLINNNLKRFNQCLDERRSRGKPVRVILGLRAWHCVRGKPPLEVALPPFTHRRTQRFTSCIENAHLHVGHGEECNEARIHNPEGNRR